MASATIESVLQEDRLFPPSPEFVRQANVSGAAAYQALCDEAERDFEGFWGRLAKEHVLWNKPFTRVLDESNAPFFKWFHDGELNASYNCLDRHLKTQGDKTAIVFEADDGKVTKITYKQLYHRVCQFANALKALGIKKGERVIIYMPMSIEVVTAMQACARIGATHSVVFGGFSAKSLQERIIDAGAVAVITADGQMRGGKEIALKPAVDEAFTLGGCEGVKNVVVYKRTGTSVAFQAPRDKWWHDVIKGQAETCEPTWVNAEHPLFILYTSGSTGKPKGVQHSTGGYLLMTVVTMKWVFDYKPTDVFWCTADVGWVAGRRALLENDPGPQGDGVLHRTHRDPHAHQGGGRSSEEIRSEIAAHPRHRRRADQPRGVDVVLQHRRRQALPDRRHLVADRNQQPSDHAAPRRACPEAGLLHDAAARNHGGDRGRDRPRRREGQGRNSRHQAPVAGNHPHHLGRSGALQEELLSARVQGRVLPRGRRREPRQGRLLPHHGPHRRRAERLGAPARHDGDRIGAGGEYQARRRGRCGGPARRNDGRSRVRIRRAEGPAAFGRRGEEDGGRVAQLGGEGDRRDRQAQGHPLWRQPAQDALGENHAASAALDRQGRGDQAGRVDAGEPGHSRAVEASYLIFRSSRITSLERRGG